jgi:hypothetical protein
MQAKQTLIPGHDDHLDDGAELEKQSSDVEVISGGKRKRRGQSQQVRKRIRAGRPKAGDYDDGTKAVVIIGQAYTRCLAVSKDPWASATSRYALAEGAWKIAVAGTTSVISPTVHNHTNSMVCEAYADIQILNPSLLSLYAPLVKSVVR